MAKATKIPTAEIRIKLTTREIEILGSIACGHKTDEVASLLRIAPETVRTHIKTVCKKLGAKNKTHAVALAIAEKLFKVNEIHPKRG